MKDTIAKIICLWDKFRTKIYTFATLSLCGCGESTSFCFVCFVSKILLVEAGSGTTLQDWSAAPAPGARDFALERRSANGKLG